MCREESDPGESKDRAAMTDCKRTAMTIATSLVGLAGLIFIWMLLQAGQFTHAVISFGLVVFLLIATASGRAGALLRLIARAPGFELNMEYWERQTRQAFIQAIADLPEKDRAEALKCLNPLIKIIALIRAELAALGIRLNAIEEEVATLRSRSVGRGGAGSGS